MRDSTSAERTLRVGVLALQGAFAEHLDLLVRAELPPGVAVEPCAVRTPDELADCEALVIPGGESTSMALIARRTGLLEPLRDFVRGGRAVWGTCAGMILLADEVAEGSTKRGGQEGIGGLPMRVVRNQFGRQVRWLEASRDSPASADATHRSSPSRRTSRCPASTARPSAASSSAHPSSTRSSTPRSACSRACPRAHCRRRRTTSCRSGPTRAPSPSAEAGSWRRASIRS